MHLPLHTTPPGPQLQPSQDTQAHSWQEGGRCVWWEGHEPQSLAGGGGGGHLSRAGGAPSTGLCHDCAVLGAGRGPRGAGSGLGVRLQHPEHVRGRAGGPAALPPPAAVSQGGGGTGTVGRMRARLRVCRGRLHPACSSCCIMCCGRRAGGSACPPHPWPGCDRAAAGQRAVGGDSLPSARERDRGLVGGVRPWSQTCPH